MRIWPRPLAKKPVPMDAFAAEPVSTTSILTTCSENCLKISAVALTACAGADPAPAMIHKTMSMAMEMLCFIVESQMKLTLERAVNG